MSSSGVQLTENLIKTLDGNNGDEEDADAFLPAPGGFQGPRDGYKFQNGEKGVGYYKEEFAAFDDDTALMKRRKTSHETATTTTTTAAGATTTTTTTKITPGKTTRTCSQTCAAKISKGKRCALPETQ